MNKGIYAVAALAITGVMLTGCSKKDKKHQAEMTPTVEVAYPVVDSVVLHHEYPGRIAAGSEVDVVAEVNGRILSRNYEEGSYVSKGAVLFTIETGRYADAVKQAEASLASARSQHDYSQKQYKAVTEALQSGAVSQMEVNQALNNVNAAQASVNSAQAQLEDARRNLNHCTVRAPQSGRISAAAMSVGNYVSGEGAPVKLATIYDDKEVKATFSINDASTGTLTATEQQVMYKSIPLAFDVTLSKPYTADLYYTSPSVDASTGTVLLEGKVRNEDGELKDGMYVKVKLPVGVAPQAVLVNDASLSTDQLGKYLYVVNDSNRIVYTPVQIGELYQDTLRIITKGLTPKDRYVTKAMLTVRAGEEVKPVLAGKTAAK